MPEKILTTLSARGVLRVQLAAQMFGHLAAAGHKTETAAKLAVDVADVMLKAGEAFEAKELAEAQKRGKDAEERAVELSTPFTAGLLRHE